MSGLIDAHIHIVLTEVNVGLLSDVPLSLLAAMGSAAMRAMLMRGFTTLRDAGGADWGMKTVRDSRQFRMDEIEAAVDEATRWGPTSWPIPIAPRRSDVRLGTGYHDRARQPDRPPTARLMPERGTYLVPTLVAHDSLERREQYYGLSRYSLAKNEKMLEAGLRSLEICREVGVKIGFGTGLPGRLQNDQMNEFTIRAGAMRPAQIIRSATISTPRSCARLASLAKSCRALKRICWRWTAIPIAI